MTLSIRYKNDSYDAPHMLYNPFSLPTGPSNHANCLPFEPLLDALSL